MGAFLETIKEAKAKREAARQYVMAADIHRASARTERRNGHAIVAAGYDKLADDLMRNASYEVTAE